MNDNNYYGIGLGNLVAAFLSWSMYKSIGWVIIHGFLGWIYLVYWAIFIFNWK